MAMKIFCENTPLTDNDCFVIFSREKSCFDFPLHTHKELELNLVLNGAGASRVIGNHMGTIGDAELVFVNGETPHAWFTDGCRSQRIQEVTLQFAPDLIDDKLLNRNSLTALKRLFEESRRGVLFTEQTALEVAPALRRIYERGSAGGMQPLLDVLAVFNTLSFASERKLLSDLTFVQEKDMSYSQRLETVFAYMNRNFSRQISLRDVAETVNMSEVSFSRFIKKATGQNFIDTLAEIRLGHVSRMLIDTDMTIAEIAFCCGFNNMANFNRIFKRKKGMPPHRSRTLYINKKIYV